MVGRLSQERSPLRLHYFRLGWAYTGSSSVLFDHLTSYIPRLEGDVDGWPIYPLPGVDMETGLACVKSFAPIPFFERALSAFPLPGEWIVTGVGAIQSRGRLRPSWNRLLILPS
jgi:hypothetical protein